MGQPKPVTDKGQGFRKAQPKQMTVQVDDVQKMQQGYEDRIARQAASIDRIMSLLNDRTNQLNRQMEDENSRAADWGLPPIEHVRIVGRGQLEITSRDDQSAVDRLWSLVPEDWDLFNEDDTKPTALAGYIKWLQEEVAHQKGKQESLSVALKGSEEARLAGEQKLAQVQAQLDEAKRNLTQAITDARHNAKVANQTFQRVENDDDTPPWEKPGFVPPSSSVNPTVIDRNTPIDVPPHPAAAGESETVQFDGFGGAKAHAGEQRPGRF